jgi:DNA-binding transcriptional LysR family regulator
MATLRQLEYLVTVAAEGSFTRAASRLHVTQPALSHQIQALERAVGGALLERLPRTVRPTPMGRAMLDHARAALADAARATSAARQVAGLEVGELEIATLYSISLGVLPRALRTWCRQRPDVRIRLFEHRHSNALADATRAGQADIAIGPPPPDWPGPIRELGIEEFVVVVSSDDPLATAGRHRVALTELAERRWVHYTPGHLIADMLDEACAAAGFHPIAAIRTEQSAAGPLLAAAGLGPTLTPLDVIADGFPGHVLRPDPPIRRLLSAYSRTRLDPLAAAFADVLAEQATLSPHVAQHPADGPAT